MESTGIIGKIQVSQSTFELLKSEYIFEERGVTEVKGKGRMLTYVFTERLFERTTEGDLVRKAAITPPTWSKSHSSPTKEQKNNEVPNHSFSYCP